MGKAFKLNLKSGIEIEIHLTGENSELSIDDKPTFKFSIIDSNLEVVTERDAEDEIISTEEIEFKSEKESIKPLTKCINCNGRRYCITNACAYTPCGRICD